MPKEEAQHILLQDIRTLLAGFDDVRGNHWCGLRFDQCQLINLGEELAYPALWYPPTEAGYEQWFRLAQFGGGVDVASALRLAQKIKRERAQQAQLLTDTQPTSIKEVQLVS